MRMFIARQGRNPFAAFSPGQLHLKVVASRLPQGVLSIQNRGFVSVL
jgi:hypothetical protein